MGAARARGCTPRTRARPGVGDHRRQGRSAVAGAGGCRGATAGRRRVVQLMCDVLVALAPATDGTATLFAKNSDRPPGERQLLEWSPRRLDTGAGARHAHPCRAAPVDHARLRAVAAGVGLGSRARCERGRGGRRATPPSTPRWIRGARRSASRAWTSSGWRSNGRATAAAAVDVITDDDRAVRPGRQRARPDPRARRSAVLELVPRRRSTVGLRGRHQWPTVGGRAGRRRARHLQPHHDPVVRRSAPPPSPTGAPPGRPAPGRRRSGARRRAPSRSPRCNATCARTIRAPSPAGACACTSTGWSTPTASMIAALRPDGASTLWTVAGHPCSGEYVELTVRRRERAAWPSAQPPAGRHVV